MKARLLKETKAISILIWIMLLLLSAIVGALVSYIWVMSSYYKMPEDATLLVVTDVTFPGPPAINFTYFNITILNPSYSIYDVNITAIRLSVEGKNETYDITATEPEQLPFLMRKGTEQTFKCKKNWSNLTNETVRIEPIATNSSTKSYSYITPMEKLNLTPNFDITETVEYFDLTLENHAKSVANLTISSIMVNDELINNNVTPSLTTPLVLAIGQNLTFRCHWSWDWEKLGKKNVTVTVKTVEGYEAIYEAYELPGAFLSIDKIVFDYADTSYFNVTISSSENSTDIEPVWLTRVKLALGEETPITINTTYPDLKAMAVALHRNESLTIKCLWDWNVHRNETITVSVYNRQGITAPSKTRKTPSIVVWEITDVKFDLDDTEHFLINITNMQCSLQEINVTKVEFNENSTAFNSTIISVGEEATLRCGLNWTDSLGKTAIVTVYATYGETKTSVSYTLTLPILKMRATVFSNFSLGNPYVNFTIYNSNFSTTNTTIIEIFVNTENKTFTIDGTITNPKISPNGYKLVTGTEITIICPWDWTPYVGRDISVTVKTAEGIELSETSKVAQPPP